MAKLSKTEFMWMARLKKGSRRQRYQHEAVDRLIGRGLVAVNARDLLEINALAASAQAALGLVLP